MTGSNHTRFTRVTALLIAGLAVVTLGRAAADDRASGIERAPAVPAAATRAPYAGERPGARSVTRTIARVEWAPERPAQGTIFRVRVTPADAALERAEGRVAGEPLHFHPARDGAFEAIAAVPVDAEGQLELRVDAWTADGRHERRTAAVPVATGDYAMEELTVEPRYGGDRPPEVQARINREYRRARAVARGSHDTPRLWDEFVRPRPARVTSGFGNGRIFNGEVQSRHMGTDFAGATGEPVRAAAHGVVALVDEFHLGGNVVYLDHGAGLTTAYLHLSEASVARGDTVDAGQVIGRVGATGRVTGPHLHWIVRYGGIAVDGLSLPDIARAGVARD